MSDAERSAQPDAPAPKRRGKRRGRARRRHTVAKVLLATTMVLAMVSGLSVAFLYRHYNNNLTTFSIDEGFVNDRPDVVETAGETKALNILVMGSDTRDGAGNNIDGLTGDGERSDTTILLHVSADRSRAYGVSIPRDAMVDRPSCKATDGDVLPAATYVQWNEAFALGGRSCTIQQFEAISNIKVDHAIVVDFTGFKGMVDAIGGVQVCIPEDIDDRAHGIFIPAGTRKLEGQDALNYVRERYEVGDGSDVGRMKRQQAFIASMAHQVVSSNTLANPIRIGRFLEAATKSLQLDQGLGSLKKLGELGYQFRNIGLDKIQFITIPNASDPQDINRLVLTDAAKGVWNKLRNDQPLTKRLSTDAISADAVPGSTTPSATPSTSPSPSSPGTPTAEPGSPSTSASPSDSASADAQEARNQALETAGLCT